MKVHLCVVLIVGVLVVVWAIIASGRREGFEPKAIRNIPPSDCRKTCALGFKRCFVDVNGSDEGAFMCDTNMRSCLSECEMSDFQRI